MVRFLSIIPLQLLFLAAGQAAAASPYPSKDEITTIFSGLTGPNASFAGFFSHVSPTVNWTIEGTHPAAGVYTNRTVLAATFARIEAVGSSQDPLQVGLVSVIGGGDEEWSVEELKVEGTCKNGLKFDNRYAWVTRWNTNKTIVEARAYLDSALVSQALQQNEIGTLFTYADARDVIVPTVDLPQELSREQSGFSRT